VVVSNLSPDLTLIDLVGAEHLPAAGCHGGPGITFIPGYNAAVLDDVV
jgi:hypothetical protein